MNLRDLRSVISGDLLDSGCTSVRYRIGTLLANKLDAGAGGGGLSGIAGVGGGGNKLRNLIKALLLLGANLSQSREFRDLFEDVLTKVRERLSFAQYEVFMELNLYVFLIFFSPRRVNTVTGLHLSLTYVYLHCYRWPSRSKTLDSLLRKSSP